MIFRKPLLKIITAGLTAVSLLIVNTSFVTAESVDDYSLLPPFVNAGVPPLVMLVMARNHKLYYEAYNDISDLDADGVIDIGYKGYHVGVDTNDPSATPIDHSAQAIDYYGYFDSFKCYSYDSTNKRYNPVKVVSNKMCNVASTPVADRTWSGDFLNYVTTSRMDALRKVLFGGFRSTDTATETVLERVFIPQDAHVWGKEYGSFVDTNGVTIIPQYDIRHYTPLDLPAPNRRHMFANVTLSNTGPPLLRVMPNSTARIWEWVAKERPVADSSLESASGGGVYNGHPANHAEFTALVLEFANSFHLQGTQSVVQINGRGNPFGDDDYYLTIFDGTIPISVAQAGNYSFAVNGDDAVEVIVDGTVVAGWYGGHGSTTMANATANYSGTIALNAGDHIIEFRHQERTGGDSYTLYWNGPASGNIWQIVPAAAFSSLVQTVYNVDRGTIAASVIIDYEVRAKVCDINFLEGNCKQYPDGNYKPTGILQKHGESDRMYFGLMTGSYTKNTSGGVLRKNIGTIRDEINVTTGQFTSVNGIISTINKLRIVGFNYGSYSYNQNCGWITTRAIKEGECRMWGNPIGEIMYETVRYFAGKGTPTTEFTYGSSTSYDDNILGLPKPDWNNPYDSDNDGYEECAQPFMLVLSDPNSNFDSDSLPGSYFNSFTGDLTAFDAQDLADHISGIEGIRGQYYIGQSGSVYDGAPTEKAVTSLGNIRGLSPEEPTKQGSFYPASVAYYARTTELNPKAPSARVTTFSVALASPLPRIEIDSDNDGVFDITLVPFAKSVGGSGISAAEGAFQPTNTIVDVFMQEQTPTYGKFRVNFEDVEQGADHDMDAIATYEYIVNNDGTVTVNVVSEYAAGSIIQHMGYVISGTTADGTYLVVRDFDTAAVNDQDYFLDTPPGQPPGGIWNDGVALPLSSTRTFTQSGSPATILNDPLWYSAKWGGFRNNEPTGPYARPNEVPDTYFYVTNPLYLEQQLNRSFAEILRRSASGTAASVISSSRSGEGAIYQSLFYTTQTDGDGRTVHWTGQTHSLFVDAFGNMREDTNNNGILDMTTDKIVVFSEESSDGVIRTVVNKYLDTNGDGLLTFLETPPTDTSVDISDIAFVWSSSDWLNNLQDANLTTNRSPYISNEGRRYVITFIDADADMVVGSGEVRGFVSTDDDIIPYLHGLSPFDNALLPADLDNVRELLSNQVLKKNSNKRRNVTTDDSTNYPDVLEDYLKAQRRRVINFIRGIDQQEVSVTSNGQTLTLPAMRSRQFDFDNDGSAETWRLGDIVYSTPTIVATPAEDYDLIYRDRSYIDFYLKYRMRRNVVYVGANDGMLHAFNAGFYDPNTKGFYTSYDSSTSPPYQNLADRPDLGAELWAYVPFNLLPHLYWLTEDTYDLEKHVSFMDLKPRIFDAKIFTPSTTHPNGWGTVMVAGMRLGGGALHADTDFDNDKTGEPVMRSAFVVLDITDPEQPPKILAELAFSDLGFTTSFPTVAIFKDRGDISPAPSPVTNDWYLVIGSGPYDTSAGGARGLALTAATSDQKAKVYMIDLVELAQNGVLQVLNPYGASVRGVANAVPFASLDANAFVSDLVTADFNLDYRADAIYFGTVAGNFSSGWGGKLRRLVFENDSNSTNWDNDSVLINLNGAHDGQPITAAPSISISKNYSTGVDDRWIYFGTGRFFNRQDVRVVDKQTYYGIKEPVDTSNNPFTWAEVNSSSLLDTTNARVFEDGFTVYTDYTDSTTLTTFNDLVEKMKIQDNSNVDFRAGWRLDFSENTERNIGQAALLGKLLTYTTYLPAEDICEIEGTSNLYALYFTTGTAFKKSVIGLTDITTTEDRDGDGTAETKVSEVARQMSVGRGMTITPSLHVGRKSGSTAFLQTSTGGIFGVDVENPGATKSGAISWQEE